MELSIIIPTFNRSASLKKTLRSIIEQENVHFSYEVIVVDNGSSDNTGSICEDLGKEIKNFMYYVDAEPGLLTGRHKGAELAKGIILSFIDDDVELNPNWLQAVFHQFRNNPEIAILGGPSLPKYLGYPPSWLKYFWQPTPYGGKMCLPLSLIDIEADSIEVDPMFIFGLNYSIRKHTLVELGGFHPDCIPKHLQKYQGDGETGLSLKARNRKIKAYYISSALLYHQVSLERLTTAYFENWYFYNGVCSSFTDIRIKHNLYPVSESNNPACENLITRILKRSVRIIGLFNGKNNLPVPDEIIKLQTSFKNKFKEGYDFHQYSFTTDSNVQAWVLKTDYWNYRLPA